MNRIRSKPPTLRLSNLDKVDKIFKNARYSSLESQLSLQSKIPDKENLYPKLEILKKNNNPLIIERPTLSKFCLKLDSLEKKIFEQHETRKNIKIPNTLFSTD